MSRIFVKGLPPSITETDFRKHFSAQNREVTDIKLIPHRRIGYVGYKDAEDAVSAVNYFNKTFIRMSKIFVEPARPISESTPNRTKAHLSAQNGVQNVADKDKHATILSSKKRKWEEMGDKSDPKLREYLQAMRSNAGDATANGRASDVAAAEAEAQAIVDAEGDSDEGYEQIPKRRELPSRAQPPSPKPAAKTMLPSTTQKTPAPTLAEEVSPEGKTKAAGSETRDAPATDEDWLRSRTNRLLDLVDPDDLTVEPNQPREENTGRDREGDAEKAHSCGETICDVADFAPEITPGDDLDAISKTSRLFVRNLPYSATEDDVRKSFGEFGIIEEVRLPVDAVGKGKGFALVLFAQASDAVRAFQAMDGSTFQGRLIHLIPASAKREQGLDEFGISRLPLRKQNLLRKKREAASSSFSWNSLYMSQDAVNTSVAQRLGVSKSELLDPTSADAATKQAIAETTVIQESKAFFAANGVDLEAFKSGKRGDTCILVKNFPHGTSMEELRKMFEEAGRVLKVLMPPCGTIAIVQFAQANHARLAFGKLAYRRIKDSVLFLEKGPEDLFKDEATHTAVQVADDRDKTGIQKLSVNELLAAGDEAAGAETTTLFVRNLNFATSTSRLAEAFQSLSGFVSARIKTKKDPKRAGETLSMGFGFVEFRCKAEAQAALKVMDGYVLDGHTLGAKASHRGHDAAEERRRENAAKKAAAQRTKIVVKNLPFQATKQEIRKLFGTYGQLRSVRVPKKADHSSRGFAFADFVNAREVEAAMEALRNTHLLGRRLVLDYAEAETVDAEEEIEKMQRKVGRQVNTMALERLTGGGRKKVTIGNEEEEDGEEGMV